MSASLATPKTLKGAMVSISLTSLPSLVLFQYNPESLTRTLTPRRSDSDDFEWRGGSASIAIAGPPRESIRFTLELDATDGLDEQNPIAVTTGVATGLAALEVMIAPSKLLVLAEVVAQKLGVIDTLPTAPPVTLLFLGPARILPVRIDSLSVTEEAFDPFLNPIRARVDVELTVLGPDDLEDSSPAYFWALNYSTIVKEALALIGTGAAGAEAASAVLQAVRGG
jgi:hypothetical protein